MIAPLEPQPSRHLPSTLGYGPRPQVFRELSHPPNTSRHLSIVSPNIIKEESPNEESKNQSSSSENRRVEEAPPRVATISGIRMTESLMEGASIPPMANLAR